MTIVDCPNCRGEGYITMNFDDGSEEFKCQFCNGTGEIFSPDNSFNGEDDDENDSE